MPAAFALCRCLQSGPILPVFGNVIHSGTLTIDPSAAQQSELSRPGAGDADGNAQICRPRGEIDNKSSPWQSENGRRRSWCCGRQADGHKQTIMCIRAHYLHPCKVAPPICSGLAHCKAYGRTLPAPGDQVEEKGQCREHSPAWLQQDPLDDRVPKIGMHLALDCRLSEVQRFWADAYQVLPSGSITISESATDLTKSLTPVMTAITSAIMPIARNRVLSRFLMVNAHSLPGRRIAVPTFRPCWCCQTQQGIFLT